MKTTVYIITTLLTLSFNTLIAGSGYRSGSGITGTELAPAIPSIATFEESVPDQDNMIRLALKVLAPVAPEEADFQEAPATSTNQAVTDLAPVVPEIAGFEDSI